MEDAQLKRIEENRLRALERLRMGSCVPLPHALIDYPAPSAAPQSSSAAPRRLVAKFDLRLDSLEYFSIHPWHEAILGGPEFAAKFPVSAKQRRQKSISLPLAAFNDVIRFLQDGFRKHWQITLTTPPRSAVDYLVRSYRKIPYLDEKCMTSIQASVEPSLFDLLLPYQRECVSFVINQCDGRVLLADDMGLGKTVQAIAIASHYRHEWPALILSPSSVRLTWAEALHRWIPSLRKRDVNVVYEGKSALAGNLITIMSYEIAIKKFEDLRRRNYQLIIADESHLMKNITSKRTKALIPLLQSAKRCILLSGTPALSRPAELYPQISAVMPRLFPHFRDFGVRYCAGHLNHFGWDFKGASHLDELQIIMSMFMIRRRKSEVLTHLPPKRREHVLLNVPGIAAVSRRGNKNIGIVDDEEIQAVDSSTLSLWRETSALKTSAVIDYVRELLATSEQRFLLFVHHKEMLDALDEALFRQKVEFIRIDGQVESAARQQLCNRFQSDPFCRLALLSITAAGVGLTLTRASLVVFAELYWNPGLLMQAEDRAHRIGQTQPVIIRPLLIKKLEVLEKIGLSKSELETLPSSAASHSHRQLPITSFLVPQQPMAQKPQQIATSEEDFESAFNDIDEAELEALMVDFPC